MQKIIQEGEKKKEEEKDDHDHQECLMIVLVQAYVILQIWEDLHIFIPTYERLSHTTITTAYTGVYEFGGWLIILHHGKQATTHTNKLRTEKTS